MPGVARKQGLMRYKVMDSAYIARQALSKLPFVPLPSQMTLIGGISSFAVDGGDRDVLVINGYAGTGKTSVVGAVVKSLADVGKSIVLLAPTGRAAKVASGMAGLKASTIHKRIFRGNSADPSNASYFLAPNQNRDTIFFVDEASLIGDSADFSHSLLAQLARHIYSAPGCRMVLIGDEAQLPPVGQERAMAMNPDRLRSLGLNPICYSLREPVRQSLKSGILRNADYLRRLIFADNIPDGYRPAFFRGALADVERVSTADLAERLADSWNEVGQEETIIITRSNRRAFNYNSAIRNSVMMAEGPLQRGDRVIIAKNDYFWSAKNKLKSFIANGDAAEVTWIGTTEEMYGRCFTNVELRLFPDGTPVAAKIMQESLSVEGPAVPREEMERFYNVVMDSYEGSLSHKIKGAMEDPFYNALQVKYAYCVTCHKAQGGQWRHVYIDMGNIADDSLGPDFYRWLYTASTRATERLFLINSPFPFRKPKKRPAE